MKPAIAIEGLSKRYQLGRAKAQEYQTLRESLAGAGRAAWCRAGRLLGRGNGRDEGAGDAASGDTLWALKDVSFTVQPGEVIGIIGRNGAGKSTLLKVLSRITEPTEGRAVVRGRLGSLLEVGTGFHPELTGRENIYMNGSILGMSRQEINRRFDDIVGFSEIAAFLDTPVKRYSSGMYVRLAFAVAAHLDPEILIVDEVLAVGDMAFQKKCLGKMGDVARQGRTVIFVSHNMQVISALTQHCLLLAGGRLVVNGKTDDVLAAYTRALVRDENQYVADPSQAAPTITRVELHTTQPNNVQFHGKPMRVTVEVATPRAIEGARLSFQVCDMLHRPSIHAWIYDSDQPICREPGTYQFTCLMPKLRLYPGRYTLTVRIGGRYRRQCLQAIEGICPFEVLIYGKDREGGYSPGDCTYIEDFEWQVHTR